MDLYGTYGGTRQVRFGKGVPKLHSVYTISEIPTIIERRSSEKNKLIPAGHSNMFTASFLLLFKP